MPTYSSFHCYTERKGKIFGVGGFEGMSIINGIGIIGTHGGVALEILLRNMGKKKGTKTFLALCAFMTKFVPAMVS